jgi:hypothetical protein
MRLFILSIIALLLYGCGEKPVSYREQIQPILTTRCANCHVAATKHGKVVLTSYESVMSSYAVSGKEPLINPGKPYQSRLFILCATNQPHFRMPPDTSSFTPLSATELDLVKKWIAQGAQNN